MRTIFLLLMFLISVSIFGQESSASVNHPKPYVSACNNDTLKYIETNFIQNKERYIGQPYSKFSREFELDMYIGRLYQWGRPADGTNIWGTQINYTAESFYFQRRNKKFYVIFLEFEPPYTVRPPFAMGAKNDHRDLFDVYTIKDMEVKCGLVYSQEDIEQFQLWKGSKF